MREKGLLRIIDANLNRCREGLRVCEEITRFVLEDVRLTGEFKWIRHGVSRISKKFPGRLKALLESRNSQADVGRALSNKSGRKGCQDVFFANIQRAKESLRVLEECSKLFSRSLSNDFASFRFKVYKLEKRIIARF